MSPQDFGLWALATLVWAFTLFFTVWAYAAIRNERQKMWLENEMRLRFLHQVDEEELKIELTEE